MSKNGYRPVDPLFLLANSNTQKKISGPVYFCTTLRQVSSVTQKRGINEKLTLRFDYKDSATKACPKRRKRQVQCCALIRHSDSGFSGHVRRYSNIG
jgi:hypothetical protein